jgi:hypothetical protein
MTPKNVERSTVCPETSCKKPKTQQKIKNTNQKIKNWVFVFFKRQPKKVKVFSLAWFGYIMDTTPIFSNDAPEIKYIIDGAECVATFQNSEKWWCKACENWHPASKFRTDFIYRYKHIHYSTSICLSGRLLLQRISCSACNSSVTEKSRKHDLLVTLINQNAQMIIMHCSRKCRKVSEKKHYDDPIFQALSVCDACHQEFSRKLGKCGGCKVASYCSLECQKKDWKSHKSVCGSLADARKSTKIECNELE